MRGGGIKDTPEKQVLNTPECMRNSKVIRSNLKENYILLL